jgi:lysophospholipase L1-like esterase/uncharacterized protein (DUF952 family)
VSAGFQRYVAIGDSQTEGLNDADGRGGFRGWADRFAELVSLDSPHLQYANLAIRGKLIGEIHDQQLAPALAMRPDLVTVMGGLNDLIRRSVDLEVIAGHLDAILAAFEQTGATVLTNTFPDPSAIAPLFNRLAPRIAAYNARIRQIAAARGALLVDFDAHGAGTDARIWSPDRIHANPFGHSLIAAAFADVLGVPGNAHWIEPLPVAEPARPIVRARTNARWFGVEVVPWLIRRMRGRSAGDGLTPKRPELSPVATVFHLVVPGEWPASGRYSPPSLASEGFVHLSFADQVEAPANAYYADEPELLAIELDPGRIPARIVVEDSYGSGTAYPHAYGPIPVTAAVGVHELGRGASGEWEFAPLSRPSLEVAPASPDR